jgi:hypothetical protein
MRFSQAELSSGSGQVPHGTLLSPKSLDQQAQLALKVTLDQRDQLALQVQQARSQLWQVLHQLLEKKVTHGLMQQVDKSTCTTMDTGLSLLQVSLARQALQEK